MTRARRADRRPTDHPAARWPALGIVTLAALLLAAPAAAQMGPRVPRGAPVIDNAIDLERVDGVPGALEVGGEIFVRLEVFPDGLISLGRRQVDAPTPLDAAPGALIAPFWGHLDSARCGQIADANRVEWSVDDGALVISWISIPTADTSCEAPRSTFAARLDWRGEGLVVTFMYERLDPAALPRIGVALGGEAFELLPDGVKPADTTVTNCDSDN